MLTLENIEEHCHGFSRTFRRAAERSSGGASDAGRVNLNRRSVPRSVDRDNNKAMTAGDPSYYAKPGRKE